MSGANVTDLALVKGKQAVLSAPQGTPPLVVESTTKVAGLNADQLDGLDSTDFASSGHLHDGRYYTQPQTDALLNALAAATSPSGHTHITLPSTGEKAALAGTTGAPGEGNRYVTNGDTRLSDSRTPKAHKHAAADIDSGVLSVARGGTGLDASAAPDGSLLIGTGTGLELGALEAGVGVTITRTATGIRVTASGGAARAARAYLSADQSIPGSTWTTINLASESHDTDALHDTVVNPSRIKLDKVGIWEVFGQVAWAQSPTYDGYRGTRLLLTSATVLAAAEQYGAGSAAPIYAVAVRCTIRVTDTAQYVEMQGHHFNGGGLPAKAGAQYTYLEASYMGSA